YPQQLIPWRGSEAGNMIPRPQSLPKHLAYILGEYDLLSFTCLARSGTGVSRAVDLAWTRRRQKSICYRGTLYRSFAGDLCTGVYAVRVLKKGSIGVINGINWRGYVYGCRYSCDFYQALLAKGM